MFTRFLPGVLELVYCRSVWCCYFSTSAPQLNLIDQHMKNQFEFEWKGDAQKVIVTGDFDSWQQSLELSKVIQANQNSEGIFTGHVMLETPVVNFKFVVDDQWVLSDQYETAPDGLNNQLIFDVRSVPKKAPVVVEPAAWWLHLKEAKDDDTKDEAKKDVEPEKQDAKKQEDELKQHEELATRIAEERLKIKAEALVKQAEEATKTAAGEKAVKDDQERKKLQEDIVVMLAKKHKEEALAKQKADELAAKIAAEKAESDEKFKRDAEALAKKVAGDRDAEELAKGKKLQEEKVIMLAKKVCEEKEREDEIAKKTEEEKIRVEAEALANLVEVEKIKAAEKKEEEEKAAQEAKEKKLADERAAADDKAKEEAVALAKKISDELTESENAAALEKKAALEKAEQLHREATIIAAKRAEDIEKEEAVALAKLTEEEKAASAEKIKQEALAAEKKKAEDLAEAEAVAKKAEKLHSEASEVIRKLSKEKIPEAELPNHEKAPTASTATNVTEIKAPAMIKIANNNLDSPTAAPPVLNRGQSGKISKQNPSTPNATGGSVKTPKKKKKCLIM